LALNLLRDRAHADQRYVRELISVLVSENLLDEAWTAAMANPGQVPESQWFQVIEIGLERASDKYRYPKAIKTIRRLRDSYHRAGDEAGFTAYLADLRQRHRRKTSFITKLDKALVRHKDQPAVPTG
jgi:signal transduction histidine kinase